MASTARGSFVSLCAQQLDCVPLRHRVECRLQAPHDGFVERFAQLGLARKVLRRRGRYGLRDGAGDQIRQVLDGCGAFC